MEHRQVGTTVAAGPYCVVPRRCGVALMVALVLAVAPAARGGVPEPSESRSYRPYQPIELTSLVFEEPRPIRAWTAKIDVASPEIEFVVTPAGDVGEKFETACATTADFAKRRNVQLAINGSPFSPFRERAGEGMDIVGIAAHDGEVYSPPHARYGALVVAPGGAVGIVSPPFDRRTLAVIDEAVGGFHVLVREGRKRTASVTAGVSEEFAGPNPRTAVGLSADRQTMWLIVIDGRNAGRSEGMSLGELADLGLSVGCHWLLNMDGGGSTTLVLQDPASKQWRVVNQPVHRGRPETLRLVGNNLGIRVRAAGETP